MPADLDIRAGGTSAAGHSSRSVAYERRAAPLRRIVSRERHGKQVTDRLACGHTVSSRYTGWQTSRKCTACAEQEADRG